MYLINRTCNSITDARELLYSNLGSGAESGWDFSSRWFAQEDASSSLTDTIVKDIIPVDLNSILCWNEQLLSSFYDKLGTHTCHVVPKFNIFFFYLRFFSTFHVISNVISP